MRKQWLLFLAIIVLTAAGGWFLAREERVSSEEHGQFEQMGTYKVYSGTESALQVTLEYPEPWALYEDKGKVEFYREVRIVGPRNGEDTYTPYISVRGSPMKVFGGRHENLDELVRQYRSHLIPGTEIVSEAQRSVAGLKADELTLTYTMPAIHHKGIRPIPVPLKERRIFIEKHPYLYELTYSADAREYDRYAEAFERVVKTLRFQ